MFKVRKIFLIIIIIIIQQKHIKLIKNVSKDFLIVEKS